MAVNLSSSSPDGAQFITGIPNGHRSIDRSSSFRDSHEAGRTHGGGGGGGNTPGPASDPSTLSQLLSLDPIPYAYGEQRNARQTELRRVTNAITGSLDDPSLPRPLDTLGAEEIRRVKTGVSELSARAKERSRHLSEAVAKLDRYRQSRKRFKPDTSSERVPGAPPADRNSTLKAASSSQVDGMKPAEKSKSLVPNKRLRTSIAGDGARPNSNLSMKKSADRESPRSSGVLPSPTPTDDKTRVPSEGWEKNKLKGRRSGIKTDPTIPSAGNGVIDGERDHKWSGQHRLSQEARPRPNDTHGLRSGPVHGVTSIHKTESSMQMNGTGARGATEVGGDKVDRSFGTDKERLPKNGVKPPLQDDMHNVPGGSAVTKGKAARAPRSGSMSSGHFSHLNRVTALSEKPQGTAKSQIPSGQGNRKRPASSIVQWVGQRPQKMARVARRVNVPPGGALPAEDTNSVPEAAPEREPSGTTGPRLTNNINGVGGVSRRVPGTAHSPAQSKLRSERIQSSVVVSESEESEGVSENKVKDKGKKYAEWDPRPASNHKSGGAVPPAKSSSLKEEVGDGVRRQGRSGRNFCMPKPVVTTIEKVDVATSTAKQFSARIEKPDRPGRTPTKKATVDRKSVSRIRRPIPGTAPEIGDSDDYHEELVAAVRDAVEASALACRSDFWKEMEPYFAFLTSDDISYLHQLADSKLSSDLPANDGVQKPSHFANGTLEPEGGTDRLEIRSGGRTSGGGGWFDRIYPLSQRLLAALINEGEDEAGKSNDGDGYSTSIRDQSHAADGSYCSNGHGNNQSSCDGFADGDEIMTDGNDFYAHLPGMKTEGRSSGWDSQYEHMNLDDRILFELQSIGLAVEQVPDLYQRDKDEICVEISKLKEELKDQASQNRQRVECLEKSITSKRDEEIRERERLAISKLVENAYTRRKGCRGSSGGAGTKGAGNKGTRAAALASAKRAMARVHRFEAGHSILDPSLRDILLCNVSKSCEAVAAANSVDTSGTPAASETSLPKSGGKLAMRRTDVKEKSATEAIADHVKGKDNSWSSWKEREVSPEDVTGATSVRNSHGGVGFGGAKGKRSERERDGKGQGKESHRKADNDRAPRQGITIKGERKTKTKPRQKAALFKDVNGLGKPAEAPRENSTLVSPSSVPAVQGEASGSVVAANLDLAIAEDLGVGTGLEQWFSSFSSSLEDTTLQDQGELLVGLDVPMDDLADLGMMM